MSKVLSLIVPALALAATTLHSADANAAGVRVVINGPAAPAPLAKLWVPGHYTVKAGRKVWVRGHYKAPPVGKALWVKGHYDIVRGKRVWIGGHWR